MSESPRTRRVRINSTEMPATHSPSSPLSSSKPKSRSKKKGKKSKGKKDNHSGKARSHFLAMKLRKLAASPVTMQSPGGPKLSPRKQWLPYTSRSDPGNMSELNSSLLAMSSLSGNKTTRLSTSPIRRTNNFTASVVSPGTRQYLETSFNQQALTVQAEDTGDQHLLRALLMENTTMDTNQLHQVCRQYEKSIAIRDGDAKVAERLYNYGSFCFWRLRNIPKAIKLFRHALHHLPKDPELSFALGEALHLANRDVFRSTVNEAKNKKNNKDGDDDDEPKQPKWNKELKTIIKETTKLFDLALETYDEDISVVLAAAEFFVDIVNIERAEELYETVLDLDLEETKFSLRRKQLTDIDVKLHVATYKRDVLKDCDGALEILDEILLEFPKDYNTTVCAANTLRVRWENKKSSDREPGLFDKDLKRAQSLCLKAHRMAPSKSDSYWCLGRIERCRGSIESSSNKEEEEDSSKKKKRKKRKKKKTSRKKNTKNTSQGNEKSEDVAVKGTHLLIKAIGKESHHPKVQHLLYVANLLFQEGLDEKKMLLDATLNTKIKINIEISDRMQLANEYFKMAVQNGPKNRQALKDYASFLENKLTNLNNSNDLNTLSFKQEEAKQKLITQIGNLLETACTISPLDINIQLRTCDYFLHHEKFRKYDAICVKIINTLLLPPKIVAPVSKETTLKTEKKTKMEDPEEDEESEEEDSDEEESDEEEEEEESRAMNEKERNIVINYIVFLIQKRYKFEKSNQLLLRLMNSNGTNKTNAKKLSKIIENAYTNALTVRSEFWKNKYKNSNLGSYRANTVTINKGKGKGGKGTNAEAEVMLPYDRVQLGIVRGHISYRHETLQDLDSAIDLMRKVLLPMLNVAAANNTPRYDLRIEAALLFQLQGKNFLEASEQLQSAANEGCTAIGSGRFKLTEEQVGAKVWDGLMSKLVENN